MPLRDRTKLTEARELAVALADADVRWAAEDVDEMTERELFDALEELGYQYDGRQWWWTGDAV